MEVSVIIPNYNHSKFLHERIDSVLKQTYSDFDLLILDDYSTDNSREIISGYVHRYPHIATCFSDAHAGNPFIQWNRGVSLSTGKYIWIAESDDSADPCFLEKTVREINKSVSTGLVYCDTKIMNEEKGIEYFYSDRKKDRAKLQAGSVKPEALTENVIPNVSSVLFRRSAYKEAGGADPGMKFCGDWLLYLKIALTSDLVYIPEPLSIFRLHRNSSYREHYRSNVFLREKLKIYSYLLRNSGVTPGLLLRMILGISRTFILRLLHFLKIPGFLIPEIPRRPEKSSYSE